MHKKKDVHGMGLWNTIIENWKEFSRSKPRLRWEMVLRVRAGGIRKYGNFPFLTVLVLEERVE